MENERLQILQMIETGQLSVSEGLRRLAALAAQLPPPAAAAPPPLSPAARYWRHWWLLPLSVGVSILMGGVLLMYGAYRAGPGLTLWFWLAALGVFLPGGLVMVLAAMSRSAKWLHLRIKSKRPGGRKLALSLPLPLRLAAGVGWGLSWWIPELKQKGVAEWLRAVDETSTAHNPLYVEVDEEDELVQVYLG